MGRYRSRRWRRRTLRTLALGSSAGVLVVLLASCGSVAGNPTTGGGGGSNGTVTVAAAGDVACDPTQSYPAGQCHASQTAALIQSMSPQAVLMLGDGQYEVGALSAYQQAYGSTWGQFKSITYPAVGNHDYVTSGAQGYASYFGSQAVHGGHFYYSFDIRAWHAVVLDTDCVQVTSAPSCAAGSAQETWLRNDLSSSKAQCTLAVLHHPYYSSGQDGDHPQLQALWQALYDNGVELVLSGHDHDYERFQPQDASGNADSQGVVQFVVGTGGFSHMPENTADPNSAVSNFTTYGVLKLTLRSGGYDWRFVPDTSSGSFTDSGSASCH